MVVLWLEPDMSSVTFVKLVIPGRITSMPSAVEISSSRMIIYGDYVVATTSSRVFMEASSVLVQV